ncbi:subtilisin-like protein [Choiromyces venosus 120613-1]|uniref:Subtilisin-like protein n=1 Tax=Choiromyces venosus 120613-1 TaxID=1336337 RepID=A0A3N4JUL6_9PEZI|nr:subtilisin-like protein [Choiromyces venosus 120613-1]
MRHIFSLIVTILPLTGIIAAPLDDVSEPFVDEKIPNSWIVQLKEEASSQSLDDHLSWLSTVTKEVTGFAVTEQQYNFAGFVGYSGQFDVSIVEQIRTRPEVALVEQDGVVKADKSCTRQSLPSRALWGLGRISNRTGSQETYLYDSSSPYCGPGDARVYVLDSGIHSRHSDFEGRASLLWKADKTWSGEDKCGHGTHVAGTVAGKTYGVSKKAQIYAVKVLEGSSRGCRGSWAGVIGGIQTAYSHANQARKVPLSVINMSLGGGLNQAVNKAIDSVVKRGLTVVVAAGNSGDNACDYSPASAKGAIAVAASDSNDTSAPWTNKGCCVDLYAPGVDVLSAWIGSDLATNILSGTSMASPHVAGLVLYKKCLVAKLRTPASDLDELKAKGIKGVIKGDLCPSTDKKCCSPNILAYNGGCP